MNSANGQGNTHAVILQQLKQKYDNLSRMLDPYLVHCFTPIRLFPERFEERLKQGMETPQLKITMSEVNDMARTPEQMSEHTGKFAHPSEALLAYFSAPDLKLLPEFEVDGLPPAVAAES